MAEELSAIEQYRAAWKPNPATIALLEALLKKAQDEGDWAAEWSIQNQLWDANRPPRNLPIKRLDVVE